MSRMTRDVAVVGGGMAGASVAAELSRDHSVVLLEAEPVTGVHSTGRSAATFLPSYGGPIVRQLTAASRPLYDAHSAAHGAELLTPRLQLWLANDSAGEDVLAQALETQPHVTSLTAREAVALFPALRAERVLAAVLDSGAMDIDVASLHLGYLKDLRHRQGTVLLRAPVSGIRRAGRAWEIVAGDFTISCEKVVNAAGAWADEVAALAGVPAIGLQPKLRTAFISQPHYDGEISRDWPLLIDACERWYVKPENGSMLASPADEIDSPPCDARPDELGIALAIEAINHATSLNLRSVRRAWAGLRSFVADRAPVVGSWTEHENFFFMAGQGGYGIQMAPALAVVAAEVIAHGRLSPETRAYGVTLDSIGPDRLLASR